MSNCPICSGNILRHIKSDRIYWYCSHCYQEVPDFSQIAARKKDNDDQVKLLASKFLLTER